MQAKKNNPANQGQQYLIYSASESDMNREPMFWSNAEGWGDLGRATKFTASERNQFTLPHSIGSDARWLTYEESIKVGPVSEVELERNLLAQSIRDAAVKIGICREDVPLTGPHLLRLLENMADQISTAAENGNVYSYEFECACPVNGEAIKYSIVIDSQDMIPVERIIALTATFTEAYHEDLADEFYKAFGGKQRMSAFHHGVHIKTIRTGGGTD